MTMPAVAYPVPVLPAQPLTPVRDGPRYATAADPNAGPDNDRVTTTSTQPGDPAAVSGPAAYSSPSLLMGSLGWGTRTARFTVPSAPDTGHGIRPLADARQWHYNAPGTIPGPGGDYLTAGLMPITQGPPAEGTPPVTLGTVAAGLRPWASSVADGQGH